MLVVLFDFVCFWFGYGLWAIRLVWFVGCIGLLGLVVGTRGLISLLVVFVFGFAGMFGLLLISVVVGGCYFVVFC